MHPIIIKTLILIAIFAFTRQDLYISPSNCSIYFTTDHLITYSFQNCVNGNNFTFNSWSNCQIQCCPKANPNEFSSNTLKECQGTNSESGASSLRIIIALCVFAFIIISLLVICNRWKAYKHRVEMQKLQDSLAPHQKGNLTKSIKDQKWVQEETTLDTTTVLGQNIKQEVCCSICLDPKTTIGLVCKHEFHEDCAGKWFQKNLTCPMCRQDVHFIKVKCQKLCKQYMLLRWEDYESTIGELSKACPKCIQTEKDITSK